MNIAAPSTGSGTERPSPPPMLLCRVSWLEHYDGRADDGLYSNHRWVTGGGDAHESMNFLPSRDGYMLGNVQVRQSGQIRIQRLGARKSDDSIEGVTVVWCAQSPFRQGLVIVGWYRNATVFRHWRAPRDGRAFAGSGEIYTRVEARAADCFLLDASSRDFVIQPKGAPKGSVFGQSDLCYVDERLPNLSKKIRQYIQSVAAAPVNADNKTSFSDGIDPDRNAQVEIAAVELVKRHFRGWRPQDRQADNCGWDWEFRRGDACRCVEVKGRSVQSPGMVRLSANEERAFNRAMREPDFAAQYRLAIVYSALTEAPRLMLFAFSPELGWQCEVSREQLLTQSAGIFAAPISNSSQLP